MAAQPRQPHARERPQAHLQGLMPTPPPFRLCTAFQVHGRVFPCLMHAYWHVCPGHVACEVSAAASTAKCFVYLLCKVCGSSGSTE